MIPPTHAHNTPAKRDGMEGGAERRPGSAEILAGKGTRWYFAADKQHTTCQPREIGEDVLLLSQQLW